MVSLCSAAVTRAEANRFEPVVFVVFFVQDHSTVIINMCPEMGSVRGLDFHFVDKKGDKYDYRVALSAEGSSMRNNAQGNIVILSAEAKVLFTMARGNRMTERVRPAP